MAEHLKRRIGLGLLTAYGVGVMVGAGIYVLVGAIAAEAGIWAPLSFLLAGLIAAPSALSYAEFSTRLPEAAGEAIFVAKGLGRPWLALVVGLAVVAAGTISAAAVLRGGTGYLVSVVELPFAPTAIVMGLFLVGVAIAGVLESLTVAAIFTVIEVIGLALVIWAGASAEPVADWQAPAGIVWSGVASAAVLAFFAFIGFEDIVNMAEEVRDPTHTLPRAILLSLLITSLLYALVSWAAVRAVPLERLAVSEQPLALVWSHARGGGGVPVGDRGGGGDERHPCADRDGEPGAVRRRQAQPGIGRFPPCASAPWHAGSGDGGDRGAGDLHGGDAAGGGPCRGDLGDPAGGLRAGQ